MVVGRIIKNVSEHSGEARSFQVEVRHPSGASSRWPDEYRTYGAALAAAEDAGVELLLGWREEHVWGHPIGKLKVGVAGRS